MGISNKRDTALEASIVKDMSMDSIINTIIQSKGMLTV